MLRRAGLALTYRRDNDVNSLVPQARDMLPGRMVVDDHGVELGQRGKAVQSAPFELRVIDQQDAPCRSIEHGALGLDHLGRLVEDDVVGDRGHGDEQLSLIHI